MSLTPTNFKLWLQVTLEDTVAEFFYAPLAIALLAWGVCFLGLFDFPHQIFAFSVGLLLTPFVLRSVWIWNFIRKADMLVATVGMQTKNFRKWCEHLVHFSKEGADLELPHVFLKNEVKAGDQIVILSKRLNRKSILVVHRSRDKQSLFE